MKAFILAVIMFAGSTALAYDKYKNSECDRNSFTKIDTSDIYAEIISESHMHMKFALVVKNNYSHKTKRYFEKVIGGMDYTSATLPNCDESKNTKEENERSKIKLQDGFIATDHALGDSVRFYTAYRLCFADYSGKSYHIDLCDWETGD